MADWHTSYTREDCGALQTDCFSHRGLIIAANRGPLVFKREEDGSLDFQRVGGGEDNPVHRLRRRIRQSYTWDAIFLLHIKPLLDGKVENR